MSIQGRSNPARQIQRDKCLGGHKVSHDDRMEGLAVETLEERVVRETCEITAEIWGAEVDPVARWRGSFVSGGRRARSVSRGGQ